MTGSREGGGVEVEILGFFHAIDGHSLILEVFVE